MKPRLHWLLLPWLLGLWAGTGTAQEFYDNVVVVLDASGSMKGPLAGTGLTKMNGAKAALKAVLKQVPPSTHLGLLVFSAANQKDDWVFPLGPRDDERLTRAIDSLEPASGTPLGAYLKKGADRLLVERAKQFGYGSYRLLVVTDGEAQDQQLVDRYTPEILARGITVDVIGVAMRQDHTLATKAHSYRRANDPNALHQAVREVFAEVANTGTDVAQADAFGLLAAIPSEVAAAAIQALSSSGNQPIGEKAKPPTPNPAAAAAAPSTPTPPPAATVPRSQSPNPPSPPPAAPSHQRRSFPWALLVVAAVIGLSVLKRLGRRRNQ